uniref:ATP synthase subunit a n=1 Tax=Carybdea xaymacana TaxID=168719 RepID=G9IT62_9CNID|nr:ATP synthase F0 subunit 6 [Carybdea xaymacana]
MRETLINSYFDQFNVVSLLTPWLTNVSVGFFLALISFFVLSPSNFIIPRRADIVWLSLFSHWKEVIKDNIGSKGNQFVVPVLSLFILLLCLNLLGFFPYVYTVTAQVVITFSLSFSIVLAVTVLGIINFKQDFFSMWMPMGAPMALAPLLVLIETVSYFSRALSLGLRLAANLSAGHLLMIILGSFTLQLACAKVISLTLIATFISVFVVILEIAVAAIQAYVFCLLTTVYLSDTTNLH